MNPLIVTGLGPVELVIILALVVIVFGAGKMSDMGSALARASESSVTPSGRWMKRKKSERGERSGQAGQGAKRQRLAATLFPSPLRPRLCCSVASWVPLLNVDEALTRILDQVERLPAEERPIIDVLGHTLAEDIVSTFDIPPHDNIAMDGYAVQALDIHAATPANPSRLQIIGELPAGLTPQQAVEPGTAIRVMTGAPLPPGADTVVPFEATSERDGTQRVTVSATISIYDPPAAGANIRRAGEDIRLGRVVLAKE